MDERGHHGAARHPHDVAGHRRELDAGIFQHLVDAVDLARALGGERLAVAGEVAQAADGRRRHEAWAQQAVREQLRDPCGIDDVGLATWHVLDVGGVDEDHLEVVLEGVVHALPVHASSFHGHMGDAMRRQPVPQRHEIGRRRAEDLHVLLEPFAFDDAHGRRQLRLMHIDAATTIVKLVQLSPPSRVHRQRCSPGRGCSQNHDSDLRARWRQSGVPISLHVKLDFGLVAPRRADVATSERHIFIPRGRP